jgi:L-alanine-DL-glutamate epimerase-like enolase superfamily enzyme
VREKLGDAIEILVDANTGYSLDDVRRVMPAYEELQIGRLEEPFPPHDYRSYQAAAGLGTVPLAAGENHFTRFEFTRLIEDEAVSFVQLDLSKTGGATETMRIAALASAWKLPLNPHTSATGINMATTINVLAAVDRFEHRRDLWHPHSRTSSKRFQIADFMYSKRDEAELAGSADGGQSPAASGSGPHVGSGGPHDSVSVLSK